MVSASARLRGEARFMKKSTFIILLVIVSCLFMTYVELVLKPGYVLKSLLKLGCFLGSMTLFSYVEKENVLLSYVRMKQARQLVKPLGLGILLYVVILVGYLIFARFISLEHIATTLTRDLAVSANNFIGVACYISVCNSLLEELFFRGFAVKTLSRYVSQSKCYLLSSVMFALYHVSMMFLWFEWWLVLLAILSLIIGGLIFSKLNEGEEHVYASWFVHMFANFAINTVGFIMFGLI